MTSRHSPEFWADKRVLLTGHTGFKGAWLATYLSSLGAEIHGISLPGITSSPNLWDQLNLGGLTETRTDIAGVEWQAAATEFTPEVVLHLAAQSLVSVGYQDPIGTYCTNVLGTARVMEFVQSAPGLEAVLVVTTDKVYDTRQTPPFSETDFLGGSDPYSSSKAAAEMVTQSWPSAPDCVATARAGNVIGGGDWSRDRLLPDLVRAWSAGRELVLRRPASVRPWQHVVEPLIGYLAYCEALAAGQSVPRALNFGPPASGAATVLELVAHAADTWHAQNGGAPPTWHVEDTTPFQETTTLELDSAVAASVLGVTGKWDWRSAVDRALAWQSSSSRGGEPQHLILEEFAEFLAP